MGALEIGLLGWTVFLVLMLVLSLVCKPDPIQAFREDCRRRGMTFEQTQAELDIRYHFVRVRRLASDLCLERDGDLEANHIGDLIAAEARTLHIVRGSETAKRFVAWARECPEHEILYPDAQAVRMRYFRNKLRDFPKRVPDPQVLEDLRAACTILR
jgi:hypothetical protein